jgi:predicted O-linked N-acetylglucosamine transferase (SPINDLY family)
MTSSTTKTLTISEAIQLGIQYHETGNLSQAESIYRQVLQVNPEHSGALHLLGVIAAQSNHFDKAIELINKAIQLNDKNPAFYSSLGIALSGQHQWHEAITNFQQALTLNPNHSEALYNLGHLFQHQNQLAEAARHYQQFLQQNPNDAFVNKNLGIILSQQSNPTEALTYYQRTLSLTPNDVEIHRLMGKALAESGQLAKAVASYQQALTLNPNDAQIQKNLGNLFRKQGQLEAALTAYQQAIALNPNDAGTYNNLGTVFNQLGQLVQAHNCYQQALLLEPDFAEARSNLGNTLLYQGMAPKALEHYQQVLATQPVALIQSNLLFALHYTVDYELTTIFSEHQQFQQQYATSLATLIQTHRNDRQWSRKLKIGYISADFKRHSVAYFMEAILAHHNAEHFEIFCYYNGTVHDEVTTRFKQYAHHWVNCVDLSDEALAAQIRSEPIDILIDLSGHTDNNRLLVLARKPAPVQITYLGYPDTTGLTTIDYRLTDNYTDPEKVTDSLSTETLLRLPNSYFCYHPDDNSPAISELPALQNGFITFGSFNNYAKLSKPLLELWSQILQAVPNAKLCLKARSLNDSEAQQSLRNQFINLGIESERLILTHYAPSTEAHLNTYAKIDIGLDTYPYNGATTTCEALWMGVPVVTLVGERHASRMGLSILATVGLTELIANTPEAYRQICVQLAKNIEHLQLLRAQLREKMQTSPLMDGTTFTQHLETTYQNLWKTWCNQE